MATDWGTRIISNQSKLYDPLSYHYGSVWPLFTGWASMGAYAYGRPHVGYQALMANALLTYTSSLGYVTELLSGDSISRLVARRIIRFGLKQWLSLPLCAGF
jgi:glycogen debranching enzyme